MLIKKIAVFTTAVALVLAMTGCASSSKLEENISALSQKVDNLSTKVDSLSSEVGELKSQQAENTKTINDVKMAAEQAANDAQKANGRIDNVVESYKK